MSVSIALWVAMIVSLLALCVYVEIRIEQRARKRREGDE